MAGAEIERHLRIAHRRREGGGDVLHRVEGRDVVGAVLGRPEDPAVGVDGRMAAIAGDQVVEVVLVVHPVAQRDDDVALDALGTGRRGKRQLALGDAVGPVAVVGERALTEIGELIEHHRARLARLHPSLPGLGAGGEGAQAGRDGARRQLAELVAADTAGVLHRRDPLPLRQARRDVGGLAAELVGGRDLQHRIPVDRRVVAGRDGGRGGFDRRDVDDLPGLRRLPGAVHQPVAARPHHVAARGQVGDDVAPAVVGDDALDVADTEVAGLGDDPDPGLRSLRPGDHAADVIGVDGRARLRHRLAGRHRQGQGQRCERKSQTSGGETRDRRRSSHGAVPPKRTTSSPSVDGRGYHGRRTVPSQAGPRMGSTTPVTIRHGRSSQLRCARCPCPDDHAGGPAARAARRVDSPGRTARRPLLPGRRRDARPPHRHHREPGHRRLHPGPLRADRVEAGRPGRLVFPDLQPDDRHAGRRQRPAGARRRRRGAPAARTARSSTRSASAPAGR